MKKLVTIFLMLAFVFSAAAQVSDTERQLAIDLAGKNKQAIGLSQSDISNSIVINTYIIPGTHIRMLYLQQGFKNIPVYNHLNVLAFKNDLLVSNTGSRIPEFEQRFKTLSGIPGINAVEALQTAMAATGVQPSGFIRPLKILNNGSKLEFGKLGVSVENISAELIWFTVDEGKTVKLAWQVFIAPTNSSDYWLVRIDAATNQMINKESLTVYCNWDAQGHTTGQHQDQHIPVAGSKTENNNNAGTPFVVNNASYRVIPYPAESPIHPGGAHTLLTNPWLMAPGNATTLGWQFDGSVYYESTRGNNVYAYEDRDANNLPGLSGVSTTAQPDLTFDFTPNYTLEPVVTAPAPNQQFNTTNLFYWNNLVHDLSYIYGFTEPARNFQNNNQGRGGAALDYVLAEAQDGGGTNNANFATPPDGSRPRMQMYLWNAPTPDRDGDVDNGIIIHEYTHGISNRLTGTGSGCLGNVEQMGEGWSDYFALMMTQDWATALPGDGFSKPRGIGTYALNQPITGVGIRQYRYTTDMSVNPMTYANLPAVAVPHGVGTIWCTALWDMTWYIIQQAGINPNLHNLAANGGNTIALKLVTEGLRLQPCSPGFIDGRNAILKADTLFFGAQYSCAIINAFARRGMGIGALQGSSGVLGDETISFVGCSPAGCNAPVGLTANAITFNSAVVSWTAVSGAVSYDVDYKENASATWINAATATTAVSVNLTALTPSKLYDWRVKTNCSSTTSGYSATQFTTAPLVCNAPGGLTSSGITTTNAALNWVAVAGADSYAVDYKENASSTWINAATALTLTEITLSGLSASILYDWRVRTNCYFGSSAFTAAQFTTAAPVCNVPTGLSSTAITINSATVNWNVVSGAASYDVEYKTNAAATWIPAATATTATSVNLSGLASSTLYDWRVRTNCAVNSSAFVSTQFTTATPPSTCPGIYDVSTNGTLTGAATIPLNTVIKGKVSPVNDLDYYRFAVTAAGSITLTLTTLPANYDLRLYNASGTKLAESRKNGTNNELITRTLTAGTYYALVVPKGNANNASLCYTLKVSDGSPAFGDGESITLNSISLFPNPVSKTLNIQVPDLQGFAEIRIFDIYGKMLLQKNTNMQTTGLNVTSLAAGTYMVKVRSNGLESVFKMVKQ